MCIPKISTRLVLSVVFLILSVIYMAPTSRASEIEFVVTWSPGGPVDQLTRVIAHSLPANRYQISYKPGAAGRIGIRRLLDSPSMLLAVMPTIFVVNRLIFPDLEYDPDRDLEVLALIAIMPNVLVCNNNTNFKTVKDMMSSTRSLNFSASGVGANDHIATALLLQQWTNSHNVIQYSQGGANRLTDIISGVTDCMFANYPLIKNYVTDSRLNFLMSSEDLGLNIPTWQQQFNSLYPIQTHISVVVSRNLSVTVKERIKADLKPLLSNSVLSQKIRSMGFVPTLKIDTKSINESLASHRHMTDFILRSKLQLK